ncbi:Cytochrome P450 monooxygenase COX2 [Psilocybe cubensis]|uniref:Cytochrome P450 monooxygenase COX2 n=1 Tax=Psilocybe cubensis TaxID=181762 RepID=A0ACB8GKB2_PSICU|nr:Cytochrome P450 monooxygenase COX2 [Psilocybe cubensis]KAH9476133.1 Cytochrome P450 monooxygenase COX2 [Psilocybe cubensis]
MTIITELTTLVATYPVYATVIGALAYTLVVKKLPWKWLNRNPKRLPSPPGPKGYPLIGSVFEMPTERSWIVYDQWFKKYGDMVYFEALGQPFLVLGSLKRTGDLLEKRSSKYSDRLWLPMLIELMESDFNFGMLPYGQWWRRHRRSFKDHFNPEAIVNYRPIQLRSARSFLHRLLISPERFLDHITHTFGATIMSVAYGITVKESGDPYLATGHESQKGAAAAGIPGSFLVDMVPALKYVPSWFPGAGFKKKAAHWRQANQDLARIPFKYVEQQMENGTAVPCVATKLIEKLPDKSDPKYAEERKLAEDVAAVSYVGGADTTISTVQAFFMAMALYPEAQKKAQAQLDSVLGGKRLPDFNDRPSLPYINAMIKESLRWNQVAPLAVAHVSSEDDEYDGYFIPRGTIVMGNGWTILHDPEEFQDPYTYNPDRYLKDGQLNPNVRGPEAAAFGFGRRLWVNLTFGSMCPGRHMNDSGLYCLFSSILSVFDIKPPVDESGNPVQLKPEFTSDYLTWLVPVQDKDWT